MHVNPDLKNTLILCAACFILTFVAGSRLARAEGESRTLAVLRAVPVHHTDAGESVEARGRRLAEVASAIDAATENRMERAALVTIARRESGLAAYVYEGRCADGPRGARECDAGKATGLWQIHGEVPAGVDEQAALALALWKSHRTRCRSVLADDLVGAFAGYGTGGKCAPVDWAIARAAETRRLVRRL